MTISIKITFKPSVETLILEYRNTVTENRAIDRLTISKYQTQNHIETISLNLHIEPALFPVVSLMFSTVLALHVTIAYITPMPNCLLILCLLLQCCLIIENARFRNRFPEKIITLWSHQSWWPKMWLVIGLQIDKACFLQEKHNLTLNTWIVRRDAKSGQSTWIFFWKSF